MVKYLSVSEWFWDFRIFHFSTVFVTVDYVPLFNKLVAWKPSLIWRRGSQNDRGWFPPARWWLCRSETAKIPLLLVIPDWPCKVGTQWCSRPRIPQQAANYEEECKVTRLEDRGRIKSCSTCTINSRFWNASRSLNSPNRRHARSRQIPGQI